MKTKKQIDRLFREQFKDFDVTPPPQAWENIKARLQEKKKDRKVIPLFWYKVAGVAALLLLFFSVGNFFFNNPIEENHITIEDGSVKDKNEQFVDNSKSSEKELQNNVEESLTSTENKVLNTSEKEQESKDSFSKEKNSENIIADKSSSRENKDNLEKNNSNKKTYNAIAQTQKQENQTKEKNTYTTDDYPVLNKKEDFAATQAQNEKNKQVNDTPANLIQQKENNLEEVGIAQTEEESAEKSNKKSLIEYLKEKEEEEIIANTENSLDERWAISPNFAPLYYNTLGDGSSIDTQFTNNSKSGEVNYGYGVQVSYAINDKLSVRTGLNKVDLSYVTNNIEFVGAGIDQGISSINYGGSNNIIAVGAAGSLNNIDSDYPVLSDNGVVIIPRNGDAIPGSMTQSIDYFEIPLELKYGIVNNRFGINVIGGMSTLLLNNNEISVQSDGFKSVIGEANNLNGLSFSTNLGIGLDYKISKKILFNIEPMFKYQLNPYTDSNVNFKPYYLGIYSGFSYKF